MSKHKDNLLLAAQSFTVLGLKIAPISNSITIYNYNENNLLKSPSVNIDEYTQECFKGYRTSVPDIYRLINNLDDKLIGIGGILAYKGIYVIDIDGCLDIEVIQQICIELGLDKRYSWVIESGSGAGYHILFQCNDAKAIPESIIDFHDYNGKYPELETFFNGKTNSYFCKSEISAFLKIEFKWGGFTVLPPSLHACGLNYKFLNNTPNFPPLKVSFDKIVKVKNKYCGLPSHTSETVWPDETLKYSSLHIPLGNDTNELISERYSKEELLTVTCIKLLRIIHQTSPIEDICVEVTSMIRDIYYGNIMRRDTICFVLPGSFIAASGIRHHFIVGEIDSEIKGEINSRIIDKIMQPVERFLNRYKAYYDYSSKNTVYLENELAKAVFLNVLYHNHYNYNRNNLDDYTSKTNDFDFYYEELSTYNTITFLCDYILKNKYTIQDYKYDNRCFR